MMSPVLIQWIDMHRAPVFPEELDLVFVICRKVPEDRVSGVLAYMQRLTVREGRVLGRYFE